MDNAFITRVPEEIGDYPLLYTATDAMADLPGLLGSHKEQIRQELLKYGAILFRGFSLRTSDDFNLAFKAVFGDPMEYTFRTSPREEVGNKIYTSTSHPADQTIQFHTENSYSHKWNRVISFFCHTPPTEGGETPIADERRVISSIGEPYVTKFKERGIMYIRNTLPGIGLDWRTTYQTGDKAVVEGLLKEREIIYEWVSNDHLRTRWVLPAFHKHPVTGESVWFNHMFFGHKTLYDPEILEFIGEENLPFATYYGDGTPIEDELIDLFRESYNKHKIEFKWEKGDLLLMDNMMFSHARNPFKGERKILVAMAEIVNYS